MIKKKLIFIFLSILSIIILLSIDSDLSLACGIFAFVGRDPKKHFSWEKFNILGIFNDDRGGDACGIEFNNAVTHIHGTGYVRYKNAVIEKEIVCKGLPNGHILGHTRKASSGGNKEKYIQPYVIYKNDPINKSLAYHDTDYRAWSKERSKGEVLFAGVHNGTLYNEDDLAKEYNIKDNGYNDTQILFNILFKGHYNVLSKYQGAASLIWHDYYTEITYIFRGESSTYNTSNIATEERPLYYMECDKYNYYFSSVKDSLIFASNGSGKINEVPANTLMKIKDGEIIAKEEIDRSKAFQKEYVSTYNSNNRYYSVGSYGKNLNDVDHSNDWWEDRHRNYDSQHASTLTIFTFDDYMVIKHPKANLANPRLSLENNRFMYHVRNNEAIQYLKGRYWIGSNLAHGIYAIDPFGRLAHKDRIDDTTLSFYKLHFFIEGMMLDNLEDYFLAKALYQDYIVDKFGDGNQDVTSLDVKEVERFLMDDIVDLTCEATSRLFSYVDDEEILGKQDNIIVPYTGKIKAKFARRIYSAVNGELSNIEDQTPSLCIHNKFHHAATMRYIHKDLSEIVKDIMNIDNYCPDEDDLIGKNYFNSMDRNIESLKSNSFMSKILNRQIVVSDATALYPVGFTVGSVKKEKEAIRDVTMALLVHFKTFNSRNTRCINCHHSDKANDTCTACMLSYNYAPEKYLS